MAETVTPNYDLIAWQHCTVQCVPGQWRRWNRRINAVHNPSAFEVEVTVVDWQRWPKWGDEARYLLLPGATVHVPGRDLRVDAVRRDGAEMPVERVGLTLQWSREPPDATA